MKKNTHPKYQEILFVDSSTGHKFLCGSTLQTEETDEYKGKTYPSYRASISSASHPFFTGSHQLLDAEGRVDKFKKRYAMQQQKQDEQKKEDQKEEKSATESKKPKKK